MLAPTLCIFHSAFRNLCSQTLRSPLVALQIRIGSTCWLYCLFIFQIEYTASGKQNDVGEVLVSSCWLVIGVPTPPQLYVQFIEVWNGFTWYTLLSFIELKIKREHKKKTIIFWEPISCKCLNALHILWFAIKLLQELLKHKIKSTRKLVSIRLK
jgi:hypothetical protein